MSDYQAYGLGLSPGVLDTIRAFRSSGGIIYSLEQLRRVVDLPDSLIDRIDGQLRFPTRRQRPKTYETIRTPIKDLNKATEDELRNVHGIGPTLSRRIIKFRTALGGFLQHEQLYDVYGLDSTVVDHILQRFEIKQLPRTEKIRINSASVSELASNVYITWEMARKIVAYRERNGTFESWADLEAYELIPKNRIARIRLYLSLEKKLLE